MRLLAAIAGLTWATQAVGQEEGNRLNLMCFGGGAANKASIATAYGLNSEGGSASGQVTTYRSVGFEDQVLLWIEGGKGEVRMPPAMNGGIGARGKDWSKLKSIDVSEREITASVSFGMFNNPKVRIDRVTRVLSLSGKSGDFTARCEAYDPENTKRAF